MTTRHRLALIGLGMGATPHAQSLIDLESRVEVVAACTRSAERASAFGARFGFPLSHDIDAVIGDPRIDCVLIATPPGAHLDLALRCAAVGKHVLHEKPLELSLTRAEALRTSAFWLLVITFGISSIGVTGLNLYSFGVATIGAVVTLFIKKMLFGKA